jgi:peptide/nickel transport system substrate-binding protein
VAYQILRAYTGVALTCLLAACGQSAWQPRQIRVAGSVHQRPNTASPAAAQNREQSPASEPRHGGAATVLLGSDFAGSWPSGLDPASNVTGGANLSLMNAIFGGLFQLTADADGSNPRITGVLATDYDVADGGRTILIHIRRNVTFSDGTPFNAEAVKFSMLRNLASGCSCTPNSWPWVAQGRITAPDAYTVALHFVRPYGPVMNAFPGSNLNWIVSPAAVKRLGDQFKITPVGAGPFRVVSDQLSSKLVLERNPLYWEHGRPYLDRLTFQSIGNEQSGYQALVAGGAQAYEGMTSSLIIHEAEANKHLTVTWQPPTSPDVIQLNTAITPFNDERAREAIYYATNVPALSKGLYSGLYPVSESFTASGGLFYHATIPGYRTYDAQRARTFVKELGGLHVTLGTLRSFEAERMITALQSQWKDAGIDVRIETYDLGELIMQFQSKKWQAMLQTAGSYDPDAGSGLSLRFGSKAFLSGVHDPVLDGLIHNAVGTLDTQRRDRLYFQIANYISDKAYAPFLLAQSNAQITRGIYGPGLTTRIPALLINTAVLWQDVWMAAP